MYYVKEKFGEAELRIEITDENVYTTCAGCGEELQVDLCDVVDASGELDLFGTTTICAECTQRERSK